MVESEGHFILHCPTYDSLCNTSKFIAETLQELGKGTAAVRHILIPQTKQYCKSVIHSLGDALNIRKIALINMCQFVFDIVFYLKTKIKPATLKEIMY